MKDFEYEVVKEVGIIGETKRETKEVNLISYGGSEPYIDIRKWDKRSMCMGKGIALKREEAKQLKDILNTLDLEQEEGKV